MSDYSIKSRRCSMCGVNYPPFVAVCRVCEDSTWANSRHGPDEDWTQRVEMLKALKESGQSTDTLYPHRHNNAARIYKDDGGRFWVTHSDLLENGYRAVTEGTILYLNEEFYETSAYVEKAASWWIEHVVVDGAADSLEPSMFANGDGAAET